jgi:hypothetical protein
VTPGLYTLQLYRGDTYHWQFTLYDDLAQTQPSDLTGVTVNSQIRDAPGGSLICTLACVVTLPNIILVTLAATDSANLPSSAAWDLQLGYSSGDVATVLAGPVNVTPDVTNLVTTASAAAPLVVLPRARRG